MCSTTAQSFARNAEQRGCPAPRCASKLVCVVTLEAPSVLACHFRPTEKLYKACYIYRHVALQSSEMILTNCAACAAPLANYLLGNGALLAPCRRWIGKCKCARPQNECTQLVTRTIETPILSLRAGRFFFGVTNTYTTRGAQLAFGKNHIVSPQTLRGRAKTQPPGAGFPRDVRDELRSKSGVSATEY